MKKSELVEAVATKAGLTKVDATKAIEATFESIAESLKAGNKVPFLGFGTFKVVNKPARTARSPKTGETVNVPAKNVVKFVAGRQLKDSLN